MIKVCFITTTSITLNTFVVETAMAMHHTGKYDITFICSNDEKFANLLPKYIHYIPVAMKRGVSLSDIRVISQLFKIFRKEKFDMIQYSTPNASLYASIAGKLAGIKIRLYAQWGIRYIGIDGTARRLFRMLEHLVCALSTSIRAVSPMNLEFAVSEGLYKKNKVKVLGKGGTIGVDLSIYDLSQKAEWHQAVRSKYSVTCPFVFGFAGRISVDKGGRELLTAFKQLVDEGENVHLMIIGPMEAESELFSGLIEWAQNSDRVTFTGFIPKNEMCMYYAALDVLVHPTYREGFGMVLQEAAAMAVPILTTRIPGASEVMEEDVSCLLAEPKNALSLYERMKEFITDEKLTGQMGIAARKRVEENFERSQMIARQIDDYEQLCAVIQK